MDQYESERALQLRTALLWALVIAAGLLLVFIVLDHMLYEPALARFMMKLRLLFVVLLVPMGWLASGTWGIRYPHLTGLSAALAMGAMIDVFVYYTGGALSPYYAGNNIVLLGVAVLFPWQPAWMFATSVSLLAMYALVAWPADAEQVASFTNGTTFLASMGLVAVVSSSISERLRRSEFVNRGERDRMAAAKDEFLASVSHDLRTPLNVVLGYSELMAEEEFGELNAAQQDTMQRIISNARGQLTLVNDLLDLARIEQGKISLQVSSVRLSDLVPDISNMMTVLLSDRDIEFTVDVPSDVIVSSDSERVKQVLSNLLTNAVKFTDRGSITLSAARRGDSVLIAVSDTGHGMEESTLRLAFDPFWIGDHPNSGWGLGLSIVGRLLEVMNGHLEVDSDPGHGTTVRILLPADGSPIKELPVADVVSAEQPASGAARRPHRRASSPARHPAGPVRSPVLGSVE